MKLSECELGKMVITKDLRVGHIIGITYNVHLKFTGKLSKEELFECTIPVVKWADGEEYPVHHVNIELFKD
jgi:hypothetical protein